ncbi:Calcineurin-like metallo-phosphoesterase superfamily protein isoform 2 [Theobroma cacao]|uniref:Calcineurin-like metallo-phosphoesterase superfamily protein isoform 2 n=1 Tax=Theobroma cacao TaxID=3641 RepID=A0A061GIA9_THECC|nr:Calcineurin-like metallo-phosphoesterase superfamily protein isoform 2 [Theobroma cacao]
MLSALIHAPTLSFLCSSPQPKLGSCRSSMAYSSLVRIAVVGDVHDDWDLVEDTKALQFLKPDLVLFTGDFGNENVELVQNVAALNFPKAVILGNHDSWNTQQFSGKRKDRVQLQLECLGQEHVGYKRLDFPLLKLSIVGGRPFSCGGQQIFRKRLVSARYGVQDMEGSAKRIYEAAVGTPEDHLVILLAHNGPTAGLGSELNDICGKDWVFEGGDHGDPDLAQAISHLKETSTFSIPLVVFGHMHKELAYGNGLRKMIVVGTDNIIYLNAAIVPRVKRPINEQQASYRSSIDNETSLHASNSDGTKRAFTLVEILNGQVDKISENWVSVVGNETTLTEEHILFKSNGRSSL